MNLKDDEVAIWRGRARCIREQLGFQFRRCLNVPVECVQLHSVGTNATSPPMSGTSSMSSSVTSCSSNHSHYHLGTSSMNRSGSSNALARYANSNRVSSSTPATSNPLATAAGSMAAASASSSSAASALHASSSASPPLSSHSRSSCRSHSHTQHNTLSSSSNSSSADHQRMSGVLHSSPNSSAFSASGPLNQSALVRSPSHPGSPSSSSPTSNLNAHNSSPHSSHTSSPTSSPSSRGANVNMSLVGSSSTLSSDAPQGGVNSSSSDQAKGSAQNNGTESLYYLSILLKIDPFHD